MTVLIIVAVFLLVFVVGGFFAWLFTRVDTTVSNTKADIVAEERAYNPAVTLGHEIKLEADYPTQMKEARLEAARSAAALPRGANFGIGSLGNVLVATAGQGLADDPVTAVRIAHFHGWDGARSGNPSVNAPVATATAPAAAAAAATEVELVPGRDYEVIAITDDMAPEDVRKARVANAKAKSAAMKAAKTAQTQSAPVAGAPVVAAAAAAATPVAVHIEAPKLIEITDSMAPEDIRKARVANAKAQSAYNKALKAAGSLPGVAAVEVPATAEPVAQAVPTPVSPVGIKPPELIVITDEMAPEDVRKARVANAKAQSAYNKALKAAGIDPSAASVQAGAGGVPVQAAPAAAPVAEAPPATPAVSADGPTPELMGIPRPQLTEITDDMAPEAVRRARVENAKAQAAYNKALKAAGIDPASVK